MNVLLIRFSSIGDIVLTTFMPDAIKRKHPDASVYFACSARYSCLLNDNPHIQHVLEYETSSLWKIASFCKKNKVRIALDLHGSLRSRLLCFLLLIHGIRVLRYKKYLFQRWNMVRFKNRTPALPSIRQRYTFLLGKLNIPTDRINNQLHLMKDLPSALTAKLPASYIVWAIGATHATKKFPVDRIPEIISKLPKPVVIIGGKTEQADGSKLASVYPDKIISLCGETSLPDSAKIINGAILTISNDTGMMHIAAALGKPLISLWGSTVPELGFAPETLPDKHGIIQNNSLICRPCHSKGRDACPLGHFNCMNMLDDKDIIAATKQLLSY